MAKAGAMVIEWALLDAQHFGIPQRRRRVFCIAIFNPATASNCPSPLLPVRESLPRDTKKGKPKRQSSATTLTEGIGAGSGIVNAIGASIYHKSTVVNQDVNSGHLVTEGGILGSDIVGSLNTSDAKMISTQYVNENKVVVEPYVKSRRAQSANDDETWVPGEVNPTLNSFDVGDTRATTAIIEPYEMVNRPVKDPVGTLQARVAATNHESIRDGHAIVEELMLVDGTRVDDVRVYEPPVQTLGARMGTGGNNVPMLAFDTQFGSNANVFEDVAPTLKASQQSPSVAYSIREDAKANNFSATELDHANSLSALRPSPQSHHAQMFIAEPTMAVRRLTPLECERLMGWPDDHTRFKADGTEQADTHRYKQCGNGVASPVAKWVAEQIAKVEHAEG
jgi:DNA (cytosine-5)-methyltransferase 1